MITTIISYCSLDHRFIKQTVVQAALFSEEVIIVCFDCLLTGQSEDIEAINKLALLGPNIRILLLPFQPNENAHHHHNLARWIATGYATYGWILYLDGDEIPYGLAVRKFLTCAAPLDFDAAAFECFWYFRNPTLQALQTEECGLLVRKSAVTISRIFSDHERWAFKNMPELRFKSMMRDAQGPMLHHYSWVRTKEEMLAKVAGWGHKADRDWTRHVNEEFERPFSGKDFVHGYTYRTVANHFNLHMEKTA
jgi:hypothetical protein